MKYLPTSFLKFTILYLVLGVVLGILVTVDIIREDILIGAQCSSFSSCWSEDAYLLPAIAVVWPLLLVAALPAQPIAWLFTALAVVAFWLTKKLHRKRT